MEFSETVGRILADEAEHGVDRTRRRLIQWTVELTLGVNDQDGLGDVPLRRLYAELRDVLEELLAAPGEPGASSAETTPGEEPPPEPAQEATASVAVEPEPESVPLSEPEPRELFAVELGRLWRELGEDPVARPYLPVFVENGSDAADTELLWERLHLLALRLPSADADALRARAAEAAARLPECEVQAGGGFLVPPLAELGYPGVPDPGALPRAGEDGFGYLERVAKAMLWFAKHDPAVRNGHSLGSAGKETLEAFDDELIEDYAKLTNLAFGSVSGQDGRKADVLLSVDEAVRGVVPVPLPREGSWWDRILESAGSLLRGHGVTAPPLSAPYPSRKDGQKSGKNVRVSREDVATRPGIQAGQIAWVLHGAVQTEDQKTTGPRVAYVPT
ncbi:hypothetical protein ABGB12_32200 [Actinocorallia sp. B10E7]|uniref:hypothetical protein n=1 Tax=Actinocorallia sp. B10E7 TaxID=3153558 RepID=UPI00325F2B8F